MAPLAPGRQHSRVTLPAAESSGLASVNAKAVVKFGTRFTAWTGSMQGTVPGSGNCHGAGLGEVTGRGRFEQTPRMRFTQ